MNYEIQSDRDSEATRPANRSSDQRLARGTKIAVPGGMKAPKDLHDRLVILYVRSVARRLLNGRVTRTVHFTDTDLAWFRSPVREGTR